MKKRKGGGRGGKRKGEEGGRGEKRRGKRGKEGGRGGGKGGGFLTDLAWMADKTWSNSIKA